MCGICGTVTKNKTTNKDLVVVEKMNNKLVHRGPNSAGVHRGNNVILAMRRLAIIDLSTGNQPLYNEDNSIVLIANGEIYNYIELKSELVSKKHFFKTSSDCETIIHAYEEYGDQFIHHLRGMFAFCLYDISKEKVIIARDRLGEKPLYVHKTDSALYFSSEMKSILETLPVENRKLNKTALYEYFHHHYLPEPHTLIEGIEKLPAGHLLFVYLPTLEISTQKYWDMDHSQKNIVEPGKEVRKELEEIERIIIRSDVPVGVSLSGGIDSSIIAILASRYSKNQLHAFSVGYPGYPENDERKNALELSKKLGLIFHNIEITSNEFAAGFNQMVYDMDDPVADIAAYGYYRIAKEAKKRNVPVLLAGFGGDELFWGYEWVRSAAYRNELKKRFLSKIYLFFILLKERRRKLINKTIPTVLGALKESFSSTLQLYEWTSAWRRTKEDEKQMFTKEFLQSIKLTEGATYPAFSVKENIGQSITNLLTKVWLVSNCVSLGDKMSMSQSVELRLPFLDYKLYETAFGIKKHIPQDYNLGYKKHLLDAVNDILPKEIRNRTKRGFNPPAKEWMESVVKDSADILKGGILVNEHIISPLFIENALKNPKSKLQLLYAITVLEKWLGFYYKPQPASIIDEV